MTQATPTTELAGAPLAEPATDVAPTKLQAWWLAARPKTLLAGIAPVLLGSAYAYLTGSFHFLAAFCALVGSILIQIGTNLANDYFDFKKGADTDARLGPKRAAQQGWITPNGLLAGTIVTFALAAAAGIYLVDRAGWPLLVVGVASIASGVLYTGGPKPLGYLGLGDVFVLFFFGPVAVVGTYYVQALDVNAGVFLASLPMGLLSTAILVVNNLRDRFTDEEVGKNTLAVRFGAGFVRAEYIACVVASYLIVLIGNLFGLFPLLSLAAFITVPMALSEVQSIYAKDGADLNPHLGGAARLTAAFALVLSISFILGRHLPF